MFVMISTIALLFNEKESRLNQKMSCTREYSEPYLNLMGS